MQSPLRLLAICLALLLHTSHTAQPLHPRRLLQTCPDGQTPSGSTCVCNPGTRDGTLVNPLMRCNGNNTLCPWTMWRGVASRAGHVSGNNYGFRFFNFGVDGNPLSTFLATCSASVPVEVTIDMQQSYRIESINLWAGATSYTDVQAVQPLSDASNLAYSSNMNIRLGDTTVNMVTCYNSGTLASHALTFTDFAVPITSCNNRTARYINISITGDGTGLCGFRDLQISAFDPSTISTCQGCPPNRFCLLNRTNTCPLRFPFSNANSSQCTCASNMLMNGSLCIPNPGYVSPFNFTFDSNLASPYSIITSTISGKIQSGSGVNCFWGRCAECWWGPPPYGRIVYSPFNSFELTVGFLARNSPMGMQADNIINFFTTLTSAGVFTNFASGGYATIDLKRRYGATTTTSSITGTPTTLFPYLPIFFHSGPIAATGYHWTFVLNKTTLTMYSNGLILGSISGITWGAEYPSLEMFGGTHFYDSMIILPVALNASEVLTFTRDSLVGRDMGAFPCMANFYCMYGAIAACPGNLISPVGSKSLSDCACRQPDMTNYNSTHCVCNTFRKFNNITFGVCQNCPGSPTYITCPVGQTSTYTVSLECSDYTCTRCLPGSFNNVTNATVCTACPPGQFSTILGVTVCTNCIAGTFNSMTGQTASTPCPAGTFSSIAGQSVCTVCSPGTFAPGSTSSTCTLCSAGRYSTYFSGTGCDSCAAGRFSTALGSRNISCQLCLPGTYSASTGTASCSGSALGTFTPLQGSTAWTLCPSGTYASRTGLSACLHCSPGTFAPAVNAVQCTWCSAGFYMSNTGSSFCEKCIAGKFSTASGHLFENNCTSCPPATYTAFGGLTVCSNCSAGFFNRNTQASICTKCSADSYSGRGVTACTQCNAGSAMSYSPTNTVFFVTDQTNFVVRQVSQNDGSVTTVAGSGVSGNADGNGRAATFSSLGQIALSYDQSLLYIASTNCIRSMTTTTSLYTVRTVVGVCGSSAQTYGSVSVARLATIYAICIDPDGAGLYISDSNFRVKYFDFHTQTLRALIGDGTAGFSVNGYNLEARINSPNGLYMSPDKAFMLISYSYGIFHFNMSIQYARNIVGTGNSVGGLTGIGTTSTFSNPGELVMDTKQSIIYMTDQTNTRIRTISYPRLNSQFLSPVTALYYGIDLAPTDTDLYYVDATSILRYNITSIQRGADTTTRISSVQFPCGDFLCMPNVNDGLYGIVTSPTLVNFFKIPELSAMVLWFGKGFIVRTWALFNAVQFKVLTMRWGMGHGNDAFFQTTLNLTINRSYAINLKWRFGTYDTTLGNNANVSWTCNSVQWNLILTNLQTGVNTLQNAAGRGANQVHTDTFTPTCNSVTIRFWAWSTASLGDVSIGDLVLVEPLLNETTMGLRSASFFSGATTVGFVDGNSTSARYRRLNSIKLGTLTSTSCQQCTRGKFINASFTVCTNCIPGTFNTANGSTACTACPAGTYASASQSTSCIQSPIGTFTVGAASFYTPCPTGTFAQSEGSSTCTGCPAGTYLPSLQSTVCTLCTAGDYSLDGSTACSPCQAGFYSSVDGSTTCMNCLAGSYSSQRATQCLACTKGTYSRTMSSTCISCSPGNYTDSDSATICVSCQSGLYSSASQATTCLSCTAGTFSLNEASVCLNCNPGYYLDTDSGTACLACQTGAYSAAQQATECLLCPPGQHSTLPATSACTLCDEGTFASSSGTVNCSKCSVCLMVNTGLQKTCPQGATIGNVTCGCTDNFYGIAGDCYPCPPNTETTTSKAESLLDCRCIPGYICKYTKRINVRLTLTNITWDLLNITNVANSPIIDAIAVAAGVPRSSVVINGVIGGNRRMLRKLDFDIKDYKPLDTGPMTIMATVWGAHSIDDTLANTLLDPYIINSLSWSNGHSIRVAKEWGALT